MSTVGEKRVVTIGTRYLIDQDECELAYAGLPASHVVDIATCKLLFEHEYGEYYFRVFELPELLPPVDMQIGSKRPFKYVLHDLPKEHSGEEEEFHLVADDGTIQFLLMDELNGPEGNRSIEDCPEEFVPAVLALQCAHGQWRRAHDETDKLEAQVAGLQSQLAEIREATAKPLRLASKCDIHKMASRMLAD